MKQNDQKENRRDFLKNIGFGLFGISVLSNFSFENFLGSKALAKELPDFKIEGKKDLIYHGEKPLQQKLKFMLLILILLNLKISLLEIMAYHQA